jgi:nucleoside-diphosphate-sugar epimerase
LKKKNIFITGGAGYVGTLLTKKLLSLGHKVTVYDLMIYGEKVLASHKSLQKIKGDIRDIKKIKEAIKGHDTVIHLACISNDPSFELNPRLGKSINLDCFRPLVEISLINKVERFIYASSSSVYGIKKVSNVEETMSLEPLTDYSLYKAECEKILSEYVSDNFTSIILRPATVCGFSPRQRLDVVVNILTNLAFHKRKISVFGGEQLRPNIHISDMVDAYINLLSAPKNIVNGEIYNVGFENHSVLEIASIVKKCIGQDVVLQTIPTNDHRSYHISSDKIKKHIGFRARKTIDQAVLDLKKSFELGLLPNSLENEDFYNLKKMQSINLK